MLARITGEQLQLLERAVDAYWSNEDGQPKHDFYFSTGMGAGTGLQHPALGNEEIGVDVGDIEELANLGLLNVNWRGDLSGSFRPTAEGKQIVEDQRHIQEIARADRAISEGGGQVSAGSKRSRSSKRSSTCMTKQNLGKMSRSLRYARN